MDEMPDADDETEEEPVAVSYPKRTIKVTGRVVVPDAVRALVEKLRAQADHDRTTEPKAARVADAAADQLEAALRTAPPAAPLTVVQAGEGGRIGPGLLPAAPPVRTYEDGVIEARRRYAQAWCDATGDHIEAVSFTTMFLEDRGAELDSFRRRAAPPVEPREPSVPVSKLRALIERHGCAGSGASLAVDLIWLLREAEQDTERETSDE